MCVSVQVHNNISAPARRMLSHSQDLHLFDCILGVCVCGETGLLQAQFKKRSDTGAHHIYILVRVYPHMVSGAIIAATDLQLCWMAFMCVSLGASSLL